MSQIRFLLLVLGPSGDDRPFSWLLCRDERHTNDLLTLTQTGLCLTPNYSLLVWETLNAFVYSHSSDPELDEGVYSHP